VGKPIKVKSEKKYTRAQAERALSAGADPSLFADHANIHVLKKSWMKMGCPENHTYVGRAKAKAADKAAKEAAEKAAREASQ
jgi:hypothetical protein